MEPEELDEKDQEDHCNEPGVEGNSLIGQLGGATGWEWGETHQSWRPDNGEGHYPEVGRTYDMSEETGVLECDEVNAREQESLYHHPTPMPDDSGVKRFWRMRCKNLFTAIRRRFQAAMK